MLGGTHIAPGPAARPGRAPLIGLVVLGLAMLAFVATAPWLIRAHGYGLLVPCIVASGFLTLAATALAPGVAPRIGLPLILGLAIAMRLALLAAEPLLSTDIYRYVWDGRVQAAGINPYLHVPADAALAGLRDAAIYPNINRANYAVTAYPPVAHAFFFIVTRLSETVTGMRLGMLACEAVIVAIVIDLLRRLRLPVTAVVAWAWHPLAIWEIANNGHVEALMVALMMGGVWLAACNRALAGAVAVALAAMVKPYALAVLPALWRPWNWRMPLAVIVTVALCYLPYAGVGSGALGYLKTGYLSEEGVTSGQYFWAVWLLGRLIGPVPGLTVAYLLIALGVLAWLGVRAAWRPDPTPATIVGDAGVLLIAGLFFLSPNYPWYFLAVVPFLALGGGAPAWAMTLAAPLLYRPYISPDHDLAWKTLSILPFIVVVGWVLTARGRLFTRGQGASQWTN